MEILVLLLVAAGGIVWQRLHSRLDQLEQEVIRLRQAVIGPRADDMPAPITAPQPAPDGGAGTASDLPPEATGPWGQVRPATLPDLPPVPADDETPSPLPKVARVRLSQIDLLAAWMRVNWIYPLAGVALVLSGIFLVQYAVETGQMTPQARLTLAGLLAAALVAGGEWLRRRPVAGPVLPATLTGAGIVIGMAAILSALHLYDMITPAVALVLLAALAFGAIVLGWLHGPMLSALGLLAGTAVPFVLGGGGPPPPALFGYFALLALAGLGIDALRRWGWLTWLAVLPPLVAMMVWRAAGADAGAFALALLVVAAAAMTLPFGRVAPMVDGPRALSRGKPAAGVRASFVASALAAGGLALMVPGLAGPIGIAALAGLVGIWCKRAPALADQAILPLLALPGWVAWQGLTGGALLTQFHMPRPPESDLPLLVSQVIALAVLGGLALIWRAERDAPRPHAPITLAGLLLPSATLVVFEMTWSPADTLGAYVWALHAMALAALATVLALRYAVQDAGTGPRLGASVAMAFGLVALGLMLVIGQAALTIALAVLLVAAAAMDRRFDIPALGAFMVLASMALGWRLVVDPGVIWHITTGGTAPVLAALLATIAGPFLALHLLAPLPDVPLRRYGRVVVETGLTASAAIGAGYVLTRFLGDDLGPHAQFGLQAGVLILLAWVQVQRASLGVFARLRRGFAWVLGGVAGLMLAMAVIPFSPVFGAPFFAGRVVGWPLVNDLALAYLLPGLALVRIAGWRLLRIAGWALVAIWVGCVIRHLWQGPYLQIAKGIAQGELYAYTVALLVAGAVLLALALRQGRPDLRKLALTVAGLAAAKAFLVDAAGLDGLLRVGAFLALGLVLAGLAWVNSWAIAREGRGGSAP